MIRKAAVWVVVLMAVACSQEQSDNKPAHTPTASEIPAVSNDGRDRPAGGDESQSESEPVAAGEAQFELQSIEGLTWTVLPGERLCVDESSMKRTCVEVSDPLYPGSGSLFLDVAVELKNLGSAPGTIQAGELIATLDGRSLRYSLIERERENSAEIPPLGKGRLHAQYEVPIDLLNEATFAIDLGSDKPISVEFETPRAQEQRKGTARAEAAAKAEMERARDREQEALHDKCWALNDQGAPMVTREEFEWYVENCSHMYNVGDYETYLKVYRSRS